MLNCIILHAPFSCVNSVVMVESSEAVSSYTHDPPVEERSPTSTIPLHKNIAGTDITDQLHIPHSSLPQPSTANPLAVSPNPTCESPLHLHDTTSTAQLNNKCVSDPCIHSENPHCSAMNETTTHQYQYSIDIHSIHNIKLGEDFKCFLR